MRALVLLLLIFLMTTLSVYAESNTKKTTIDLSSASSISDALNELRGKVVLLHLSNGSSIEGLLPKKSDLGSPHSQLVPLEQVTGKEMFSAMILRSSIIGVEYRR